MTAAETLRQCRATLSLIDRADCKDDAVWQKVVDTQAEVDRVLRDGEKQEPAGFIAPCLLESLANYRECTNVPSNWSVAVQAAQRNPEDVALYTHPAPSLPAVGAVPEGWQLVPKEPTIKMVAALGWEGDEAMAIGHASISEEFAKNYKAILSAAPQPAAAPSGDVDLSKLRRFGAGECDPDVRERAGGEFVLFDEVVAAITATKEQP